MERIPITYNGYMTLKKELERLLSVERPKNIQAIEDARGHGDLSENAEFDAAKDRQGFLEGRISELQYKLSHMDIIDPEKVPKDRAVFGATVVLENIDTGEEVSYQLVGPDESNVEEGKISILSPLGKALVGKSPGSEVEVQTPGGRRCFELIEIL
ncbi:MAG: transcription elongation factor GreA [Deltaproteobacteria bacterium]|nr:transcription elongation factor GreA [Deltaproteobacteria bacterium]MBW1956739.1 transcription elongation factor GreA [Deltaproteobacteria bacterium]MBW2041683.1 transcription elongation factor GreA [Deltaproteobacteria bacterium]MBW2131745.1 transcription elongation factor GreA [Deltaproteobacteria bacterium]